MALTEQHLRNQSPIDQIAGAQQIPSPTNLTGNATAASTVIVAAKPTRRYLLIQNDSDTVIYLGIGAAAVANAGVRLAASGGAYEMSRLFGNLCPDAIYAIHGGVGNKAFCGLES
jgi:hypothetical protein